MNYYDHNQEENQNQVGLNFLPIFLDPSFIQLSPTYNYIPTNKRPSSEAQKENPILVKILGKEYTFVERYSEFKIL